MTRALLTGLLCLGPSCAEPAPDPAPPAPAAQAPAPPPLPQVPPELHRGPDPSSKLMFRAKSADGLTWTRVDGVLAPAASSPNLTVLDGEPVVIFVEHGEHLARVPLEGGEPQRVDISGFEEVGLAPDGLVVDPHVTHLGGDRHRLYFIYQPRELDPGARVENEVRSALSEDAGRTWRVEPGVRFSGHIVDPDVVTLPDGRWRMFLTQDAVHVKSATSVDGLTWEPEKGLRFQGGGVTSTLPAGEGWRMYFHNPAGIALARSGDGLTFTDPSAPLLAPVGEELAVESPSVLALDGSWWMVGSSYEKSALSEPPPRPADR